MKRIQMTDRELIRALRRMAPETGSLLCLGCGYEHRCSIHGCAVLREAADRLAELAVPPPTPPLTLEELRGMDGEPVWVVYEDKRFSSMWMLVDAAAGVLYTRHGSWNIADYGREGHTAYRAYRAPETGSLLCLGCGYERRCSIHDCAVLREAADRLAELAVPPPTPPLTLEELREMDGEPVWVDFPRCPEASGWMLISVTRHCVYDGLLGDCDFENCGKTWAAYRRKPEEGTA